MALRFAWRCTSSRMLTMIPKRNFKAIDDSYELENYSNVVFPPPGTDRKLPVALKMPIFYEDDVPTKTGRRHIEMRGPELVHTDLIHKQYGIVATDGGMMKWDHFEALRRHINHHITKYGEDKMFAIWRLEFPWLPRTPRSKGKKRGGGKSKIAHFVTPVRDGRVILELGGYITEAYAYRILIKCANMLPMKGRVVSYKQLMEEKAEEERRQKENMNKFTWDFVTKWNMQNITAYMNEYDPVWGGKYR